MAVLVEMLGWFGAVLMLGAYVMVSTGRLSGGSAAFHWMNALGAGCFIINSGWHGAIPSMVLNIIWSGMGCATLMRLWLARR